MQKQHPKPLKKNQKQQICESLVMTLHKIQQNQILFFVSGYLCSAMNLIPNKDNIGRLQQIVIQLQNSTKQQIISSTNFMEILVQVISYWKFVKDVQSNVMLNKFQQKVYELVGQLACNRKFLRQKWFKQTKSQSQTQSLIMMEQQKYNGSKIQQEQTIKLIQQLQQQDKLQEQKTRIEREKQSQKIIGEILKQQEQKRRQIQLKQMEMEKQNMTCQICLELIQYTDAGTLSCGHIFHKSCIRGHIQALVNQKKIDIACPAACGVNLPLVDIEQYIDGDLKQKFQKFCFDLYVEKNDKSVSWCPSPGCTAAFTFQGGLDNYRCPVCRKHYCLGCRCQYHNGMSCAEYRISHNYGEDDRKFEQFVRGAKFKQCPKCKYWVQRTEGCSTMSCRCGHQFCYDCGGSDCPHGMCKNNGAGSIGGVIGGLIGRRGGRRR